MKIRSRIALLIVVLFILGTGTIAAYQSYPKTITVIDDGKVTQYETVDVLVGEFLASENIHLNEKDTLSVEQNASITNEMTITITRWNPVVQLTMDQKIAYIKTKAYTVEEFLREQKIVLGQKDIITPDVTASIENGMNIVLQTEKIVTETRQEVIPYQTEVRRTPELKPDEKKVVQEGKTGLIERTYEVTRFNGETINETQLASKTITEPQKEVILQGASNVLVDPATGKVYEYTKQLAMSATAYTDSLQDTGKAPGHPWYGKTASGLPTFVGMVAVDKKVIPLGTKLYVEGYGIAHAGDTGSAVKGNIIDLYFATQKEVSAFGRRPRKVYILKDQTIDVRAERKKAVAKK